MPHILVVDDDPDSREMVTEYLTFRGFRVATASHGEEAIAMAVAEPPTLILMDLTMPGMDGWDATRRLKADPQTKDVIVIALTAHAWVHEEARARQSGADGFVGKPFDMVSLGDAVTEVLTRGRSGIKAFNKLGRRS